MQEYYPTVMYHLHYINQENINFQKGRIFTFMHHVNVKVLLKM